jgi:hypothetical protein
MKDNLTHEENMKKELEISLTNENGLEKVIVNVFKALGIRTLLGFVPTSYNNLKGTTNSNIHCLDTHVHFKIIKT